MISLVSVFWVLLGFFAIIGLLRGWAKEIIATMGIVLALFALNQFGPALFDESIEYDIDQSQVMNAPLDQRQIVVADPNTLQARSQQFVLQSGFLIIVTFFAYQTPTAVNVWASRRGGRPGRLAGLDEGLQQRILGLVLGLVNGWLVIGSIWYYAHRLGYPFGEYVIPPPPFATALQPSDWAMKIVLGQAGYDPTPLVGLTNSLIASLPLNFIGDLLPLLVVILFLFMLVVLI